MKQGAGRRVVPFTTNRRMVAASAAVARERSTVHAMFEVDVTAARRLLHEHRERTGEALSFTAFLVACLARAVADNLHVNALRRGRKVYLLDDITVGVLIEHTVGEETAPELLPIRAARDKTYRQIHDEIRAVQQRPGDRLGGPSATSRLTRLVPDVVLRSAVRTATRSVTRAKRSGVVTVTALGMYGRGPGWGIPLSVRTVAVTIGGIAQRPLLRLAAELGWGRVRPEWWWGELGEGGEDADGFDGVGEGGDGSPPGVAPVWWTRRSAVRRHGGRRRSGCRRRSSVAGCGLRRKP